MSLLKSIEVLAESDQSWEDAARKGIRIAAQTVRNIRSISITNLDAVVVDDEIRLFRVSAKIFFAIEAADDGVAR